MASRHQQPPEGPASAANPTSARTNTAPPLWRDLLWPILLLLIGSLLLRSFHIDQQASAHYAPPNPQLSPDWPHAQDPPFSQLYHLGVYPAIGVSFLALLTLLASLWRRRLIRFQRLSYYWLSTLILGPGLIVNAILKDHYGRPRPRDIQAYGGDHPFEPLLQPDWASPGKSFPNGHASMGFLFLTLYFALRQRKPILARVSLIAALSYGSLIGVARLAQGGHFPTDTLWSAGILWILSALLARAFQLHKSPFTPLPTKPKPAKPWKILGLLSLTLALIFAALLALPAQQQASHPIPPASRNISLFLSGNNANHSLHILAPDASQAAQIHSQSHGHGLPGSAIKNRSSTDTDSQNRPRFEYKERQSGLFSELIHRTDSHIPSASEEIKIELREPAQSLHLQLTNQQSPRLKITLIGSLQQLHISHSQHQSLHINGHPSPPKSRHNNPVSQPANQRIEIHFQNNPTYPTIHLTSPQKQPKQSSQPADPNQPAALDPAA